MSDIDTLALENQLCFAVHATAHAFAQAYKPHLEPLGLTYPQYLVMLLLWQKDGRTVGELGEPLFLDSGTLTPLLKRLEKAGYIVRTRDLEDERRQRITLTAEGLALKEKARSIPASMLCATGLDLPQLMALKREVEQLRTSLKAATK